MPLSLRQSCSGSTSLPYFGGCGSVQTSTQPYQVYVNVTTKISDNATPVDGDGTYDVPANCTNSIAFPDNDVERNCFESTSLNITGTCGVIPNGWKAVQARAMWQGSDKYSYCPNTCNTSDVRYLNNLRTLTGEMWQTGAPENVTYSLNWVREYEVDRTSGKIAQVQCIDEWTGSAYAETPLDMQLETWWISLGIGCNEFDNSKYQTAEGTGSWNLPIGASSSFQFPVDGWCLSARSVTDTVATWTMIGVPPEGGVITWQGNLTFTSTLSKPYTLAEVTADATNLLNTWDLTDDLIYPWRQDDLCTTVPVVKLDEVFATPEGSITAWGGCEGFVTTSNDGHTIGMPLPLGYGQPSGSSNYGFFAWRQDYWTPTFIHRYGNWTPQYLTKYATWWNDQEEAGTYPFLASQASFPKGAFAFFLTDTDTVYVQKYVEVQPIVPSINFFRPCGADIANFPNAWSICGRIPISSSFSGSEVLITLAEEALYLSSSNLVSFEDVNEIVTATDASRSVTVVDSTHFSISPPAPTGSYVKSTGAPSYVWNDSSSKGDYIVLHWDYNTCTTSASFTCEQRCNNLYSPCSPPIIPILPSGSIEIFDSPTITLPIISSANQQINIIPISNIVDPFWIAPADVDYVEARCSEPAGAPPLTSSLTMGCWHRPEPISCGVPANGDCSTYSNAEVGI